MAGTGSFIPTDLDPGIKMEDSALLSSLADRVPAFSWMEKYEGSKISNVYTSILNHRESPGSTGTNERITLQLRNAERLYEQYINQYIDYKYSYDTALLEYLSAIATQENGGAKIPRNVRIKLDQALRSWISRGHKGHMEQILAVIEEYQPLDADSFWKQVGERFKNSAVSQATDFYPHYRAWFKQDNWSGFSFDQQDFSHQRKSDFSALTGQLDPSFGLFNLSKGQNENKEQLHIKIEETALKLDCQIMHVNIKRDWLNPLVLSSRTWRIDKNSPQPDFSLSSGADLSNGILPVGEMTLLPTSLLLCKNLRIEGHFPDDVVQRINAGMDKNNDTVGFGPFALAGKTYGQENIVRGAITNQGIAIPNEQIIGVLCEILPKMPDPYPGLPWKN